MCLQIVASFLTGERSDNQIKSTATAVPYPAQCLKYGYYVVTNYRDINATRSVTSPGTLRLNRCGNLTS